MWIVYIVKCSDNTLYTGITTDVERRIKEHNTKLGAAYTKSREPVKLVYKEECAARSDALKREFKIKSWERSEKLAFIKENAKPLKKKR